MMRLFVEDKKGYVETFDNVYKVSIKKIDNKSNLLIHNNNTVDKEFVFSENIPLNEIKLAYLIDVDTMHEYFRYER